MKQFQEKKEKKKEINMQFCKNYLINKNHVWFYLYNHATPLYIVV